MIKIHYKIIDEILVMDFEGELDSINVVPNFEAVKKILGQHVTKEVIFNFHGVSFINSTAIGQIMDVHNLLSDRKKSLYITNLYYSVDNILDFIGAFGVLKKYATQEDAIQAIRNAS